VPKGRRLTIPEAQSSYTPAVPVVTAIQSQFPLGVAAGEAVLVNAIVDFASGAMTGLLASAWLLRRWRRQLG
jgi:hypothetical protein